MLTTLHKVNYSSFVLFDSKDIKHIYQIRFQQYMYDMKKANKLTLVLVQNFDLKKTSSIPHIENLIQLSNYFGDFLKVRSVSEITENFLNVEFRNWLLTKKGKEQLVYNTFDNYFIGDETIISDLIFFKLI
jgi:hypothetical protein